MGGVVRFIKREAVLCVSLTCALASMLFVPPDGAYAGYIDLRVLCLLFCLMAVVQGLISCGVFKALARALLSGRRSFRLVSLTLTLLPFFSSMLVTNDVALLTFVPFAVLVLGLAGREEDVIRVVVLQTLAANLGSMATPVGNPQNLYLYARFGLGAGEFFALLLPLAALSLMALSLCAVCTRGGESSLSFEDSGGVTDRGRLYMYLGLFALCLLTVFRVLDYRALTLAVLLAFFCFSRPLLLRVDYSLLLTFVCFFVFSGNLGRIPALRELLVRLMGRSAFATSLLASQAVSNVPAAVLLSGFTEDWRGLLLGVDVGGLGTPVASLASLISLKLYMREKGARPLGFLMAFTAANLAGLALLIPAALLLLRS